jgi:tripartite-type tricarboxylate transporter receptor subunit TctC
MERRDLLAALAAGLLGPAAQAQAETTRVIVGFAAGGAVDNAARLYANQAGPQTLVDNRPGAGGRLGAEAVKAAPPDGRTVMVVPDQVMTLYPHVYRKLGYDPQRDFRPVSLMVTAPLALAVGPLVPPQVKTLADFVGWCKANPQSASYGTPGAGTSLHFIGALVGRAHGFAYQQVPFRGGALAAQDMAGGQIASSINAIPELVPHLATGKIRVLAVTGPSRSRFLPEVPTFLELGLKDTGFVSWLGMFAPAKTPDHAVLALHEAVKRAYAQPQVKDTLTKLYFEAPVSSPDELAAVLKADAARWAPLVAATGYTPES